jgi:hypothetical protein
MWMVSPDIMCDQHLLGEHVELHMIAGAMRKKTSIDGYVALGLIEPSSIGLRHARLVEEMNKRGMDHKSTLGEVDTSYLPEGHYLARVDSVRSLLELIIRCERCRKKVEEKTGATVTMSTGRSSVG